LRRVVDTACNEAMLWSYGIESPPLAISKPAPFDCNIWYYCGLLRSFASARLGVY
jgi:hypothetical protein